MQITFYRKIQFLLPFFFLILFVIYNIFTVSPSKNRVRVESQAYEAMSSIFKNPNIYSVSLYQSTGKSIIVNKKRKKAVKLNEKVESIGTISKTFNKSKFLIDAEGSKGERFAAVHDERKLKGDVGEQTDRNKKKENQKKGQLIAPQSIQNTNLKSEGQMPLTQNVQPTTIQAPSQGARLNIKKSTSKSKKDTTINISDADSRLDQWASERKNKKKKKKKVKKKVEKDKQKLFEGLYIAVYVNYFEGIKFELMKGFLLLNEKAPQLIRPIKQFRSDIKQKIDYGIISRTHFKIAVGALVFLYFIFYSFCLFKISKGLFFKHRWMAWCPILQDVMLIKAGHLHPMVIICYLLPYLHFIIVFVLWLRLSNYLNKKSWPAIFMLLPVLNLPAVIYYSWNLDKKI